MNFIQKPNERRSSVASQVKRILVLGASGMLGNAVFRFFSSREGFEVYGSVRSPMGKGRLPADLRDRILDDVDLENHDAIAGLFSCVRPDVVINCVGMIRQLKLAEDPLAVLSLNALLPHRLAKLCSVANARLVHISTDCVFSGAKGMYTEKDVSDAQDLYGRSKYLGEVDYPHAITLRTSIIGRELSGGQSLIEWFLAQQGGIKGFTRAIFSGLPTVELARVIRDHVLPNPELHGVYHVSAEPISKYDLLKLVAQVYKKSTDIFPDDQLVIDRSLDSSRFRQMAGYRPKPWLSMVQQMHAFG